MPARPSDTGRPANGGTATRTARTAGTAAGAADDAPAAEALTDSPPVVPASMQRPRPRPRVQPVRRHDAAHRLLLHVLQLRQQHRLRLIPRPEHAVTRGRRQAALRASGVRRAFGQRRQLAVERSGASKNGAWPTPSYQDALAVRAASSTCSAMEGSTIASARPWVTSTGTTVAA